MKSLPWPGLLLVPLLSCSPKPPDFFEIQASKAEQTFTIGLLKTDRWEKKVVFFNDTKKEITIPSIVDSCKCYSLTLEKRSLGPGEKVPGLLSVDFAKEPGFRGLLLFSTDFQLDHGSGKPTKITAYFDVEKK